MNLTKDDKEALKSILNHPWFKVIEKLEEEARINLWVTASTLMTSDKTIEEIKPELERLRIYLQARTDFIANIKANSSEIYIPNL